MQLLRNSGFIFILAIVLGLVIPGPASYLEQLISPALMLMMSFSLIEIDLRSRGDLRGALMGFALNYLVLSGLILILAQSLDREPLVQGFVVMAAVPPAVAVLPLTRLLKGDVRLSLYAEALSYGAALILMPLMIYLFSGRTGVGIEYVAETTLLLILLPLLVSRYLRRLNLDATLPINLGFFIVTYTVIGLNSMVLFGDVEEVAFIAFVRTFVIGSAIYLAARLADMGSERSMSLTLLGSYKNLGLAAAVSVVLFGPEAGIPAAVCILAETGFYILLALAHDRASLI